MTIGWNHNTTPMSIFTSMLMICWYSQKIQMVSLSWKVLERLIIILEFLICYDNGTFAWRAKDYIKRAFEITG